MSQGRARRCFCSSGTEARLTAALLGGVLAFSAGVVAAPRVLVAQYLTGVAIAIFAVNGLWFRWARIATAAVAVWMAIAQHLMGTTTGPARWLTDGVALAVAALACVPNRPEVPAPAPARVRAVSRLADRRTGQTCVVIPIEPYLRRYRASR